VTAIQDKSMHDHQVIGVSDEVVATQDDVRIILDTAEGPIALTLPLLLAERVLVNLRAGADDAHRQRIEQDDALRTAIVPTDRPPLDTTGCMASVATDGRILLQFRHAAAATTQIFVPPMGAAMLARALGELGGQASRAVAGEAGKRRG
jgi:hypothetical protein